MEQRTIQILFALLRSAICGIKLTNYERALYSQDQLPDLLKISQKHDIAHLLVWGLEQNALIAQGNMGAEKQIVKAVYRYELLNYEYTQLCSSLEKAKIPFIPLKGAVLRNYYPEAWMRTSCDIDILVHRDDLEKAISYLTQNLKYIEKERATHDVSLFSQQGNHIELHFDLVEEGRAQNAFDVLNTVWEHVSLSENSDYRYEMTDAFFYFYHIAHMAKHFECGGCGIRPFIDLWILDHIQGVDHSKRNELLSAGGLLQFANASRMMSKVWFDGTEADNVSLQMQDFILHGGVYGSSANRVALQQKKKGGRFGYILSRVFVPYAKLKRYYPILEKHRWLMPVMQVRRWFMLLKPNVAKMAEREILMNHNIEKSKAEEMNLFLNNIGL